MMSLLLAAALAWAAPAERTLDEARIALAAGRLQQADDLLRTAASAGAEATDLDALAADLAYARGDHARAFASYRLRLLSEPDHHGLVERAALSAMKAGLPDAPALLRRACARDAASWVVLNGCAVDADIRRDYAVSARFYDRAIGQRPESALLRSNLGWSLMLQGRWSEARAPLEQALALDPVHPKASANLALLDLVDARALPARSRDESEDDFARRLNDAGVAAAARGERARAVAAFVQAIEVSTVYYERAAASLAAVETAR